MTERARRTGLGQVLGQEPYEAAIGVAGLAGLLELSHTAGSAAAAELYPRWFLYLLGGALAAGGLLTLLGLAGAGAAAGDVGRLMARRVEQFGQYLLGGALVALGVSAICSGSHGVVTGCVDIAIGCAAAAQAVRVSRAIARAGREGAPS